MDNREISAKKFWHEQIGQYLSANKSDWKTSLSVVYDCISPTGGIKKTRLGSGTPVAIMIDKNSAVIIAGLFTDNLPPRPETVRIINDFDSKKYDLKKTVMDWVRDERREYPLLVMRPAKRSLDNFMELSVMSTHVVVAEPGNVLKFNLKLLKESISALTDLNAVGDWRKASMLREQMKKPESNMLPKEKDQLIKKYIDMLNIIPERVWLPAPNTQEYETFGLMLRDGVGMPLN
jgi:hypothetical protein